jgi:prepilin-type N-terminal cleavage/methylation domain-containing protein
MIYSKKLLYKMKKKPVPFYPEGFTLIELLIAITITSAVLAALYHTFFISHKALVSVDNSIVKLQESRSFMDTLKKEMESVLYSPDNARCVFRIDDRDIYGNQASRLVMTTFSPLINGMAKITYGVEERDGRLVITKEIVSAMSPDDESRKLDLLEDVGSFTLESRYGDSWVKTWNSSLMKDVPDEVRISVMLSVPNEEEQKRIGVPFSISDIIKPRTGKKL